MKTINILIICLMTLISSSNAHVALDYPVGGEFIKAGEKVTIKWHIVVPHDLENWDLYYSSDSGVNWEIVYVDLNGSALEYEWNVPDSLTETGHIKIIMDNVAEDYEDVSQDFAIRHEIPTIGDVLHEPVLSYFSIYPNPVKETINYSIELQEKGQVKIELFTITGSHLTTILNKQLIPGKYSGSMDTLNLTNGNYIVLVQMGDYSENQIIIVNK